MERELCYWRFKFLIILPLPLFPTSLVRPYSYFLHHVCSRDTLLLTSDHSVVNHLGGHDVVFSQGILSSGLSSDEHWESSTTLNFPRLNKTQRIWRLFKPSPHEEEHCTGRRENNNWENPLNSPPPLYKMSSLFLQFWHEPVKVKRISFPVSPMWEKFNYYFLTSVPNKDKDTHTVHVTLYCQT